MKNKLLPAIIFLLLLFSIDLKSQDETKPVGEIYEIITTNGDKYEGYIKKMDDKNVIIDIVKAGQLTIKRKYIKSINKVGVNTDSKSHGDFSKEYFYSESAFPVGKGNYYYSNTMLMFNHFASGIGNKLSLGINANFYGLFDASLDYTNLSISLKYSQNILDNRIVLAGGAKYHKFLKKRSNDFKYDDNIYSLFSTITMGSKSNNISIGFTYPFAKKGFAIEAKKSISMSGMVKVNKSISLMTDLILLTDNANKDILLIDLAARSRIKGIYLDYGFLTDFSRSEFEFLLPIISIKIPFSKFSN